MTAPRRTIRAKRVKEAALYVIARNKHGRPTLQHKLLDGTASITCCGQVMELWSRAYQTEPIPEILCKKAMCR